MFGYKPVLARELKTLILMRRVIAKRVARLARMASARISHTPHFPRQRRFFSIHKPGLLGKRDTFFKMRLVFTVRFALLFTTAAAWHLSALHKRQYPSHFFNFFRGNKPGTFSKRNTLLYMVGIFAIRFARFFGAAAAGECDVFTARTDNLAYFAKFFIL